MIEDSLGNELNSGDSVVCCVGNELFAGQVQTFIGGKVRVTYFKPIIGTRRKGCKLTTFALYGEQVIKVNAPELTAYRLGVTIYE